MLRLEIIDPGLVAMVDAAGDAMRRAAAVAAASLAQERTGLNDRRVLALFAAVEEGRIGDCPERRAVNSLVEELDDLQLDVQDRVDAGEATAEEHLEAFSRGGQILDGHHRWDELLRRVNDGRIPADTQIQVWGLG